jgi:DNA-binding IclR family transcriptional regulator
VGETVHLGQLEGQKVHFIDSIESTRAVRVGSRLGRSMPAHCTSTGKAMLAQLSDTQLFALYPEEHLEQLTPQSIASREELVEALDEVRKRGYATSREESEEEVSSVAISLSAGPTPLMALNVSVPTNRMTATARKKIVEKLRQAAEEINTLVR